MATPIDVLVVGAGPAGAVAALRLAEAGLSVRLLDRARFPRDKLCGDTINPGTLALIDRLGAVAAIRRVSRSITGMVISGPGGATVIADYPDGLAGAAVRRAVLDEILLERAMRGGAELNDDAHVTAPVIDADGRVAGVVVRGADGRQRDVRARLVIAADGRSSRLAAALRLARSPPTRRWAFGARFAGVSGMTTRGEMHVTARTYMGIAPLPDGTANVCVVRDLTRPRARERIGVDEVIGRAVEADEAMARRFATATRVSDTVVLGPLGVDVSAAGVPGLLLAGDAAGFIDPMTGDGLRFAIRGGELAASAAIQELASGVPGHVMLATARRAEFAGKSRFNRSVRWLTRSGIAMRTAALVATWCSPPFERLVSVAGDCGLARRLAAR